MSKTFFLFLALLLPLLALAQNPDTTIYNVVDEPPRFPGCEELDTTLRAKQLCAEQRLLQYVYSAVAYPEEARRQGLEGTAVLTFVIEKDGRITQPSVLRDPGAGIGTAALASILYLQQQDIRWRPGRQNGAIVRSRFNLPVRFKLEDPLPYIMVGQDTLYTQLDSIPRFEGGEAALQQKIADVLQYPSSGEDSCAIGTLDVSMRVDASGYVSVLDVTDFNALGDDFWYEAINAATATGGQWQPALYEGRPVPAGYELSLFFSPKNDACQARVAAYKQAQQQMLEGQELVGVKDIDGGLAKMTEALNAFPREGSFLLIRGQIYLNENRFAEACTDLSLAKEITLVNWFDSVLPLICR